MSRSNREIKELTFEYLLEISAGTCSITDTQIRTEEDHVLREIMAGFLFLHEELEHRRRSSEEAQAALLEAKEMAEASNQAKTRFLANVSHELRTPMNGVLGMTELILQTELKGEQLRYAQAIQSSARSLLVVINDVLDMAKIESGRLQIHNEPFDLEATTTALLDRYALLASDKESWLHLVFGRGVPKYLVGDAGRLGQILTNYIGNAIKFTARGTVTLEVDCESVRSSGAELRFSVVDTGIGIPRDKIDLLFQPFSQIDSSMKRAFSGTGLGLAISKQLASLLGGEVGVTSDLGLGSTFWLRVILPIDDAQPNELVERGKRSWSPGTSTEIVLSTPEPVETERKDLGLGVLNVLVVEDNVVNRVVATRMLESLGCRVETAVDGVDGVDKAKEGTYDIVFMDCQMPRMDGFEATAAIRAQPGDGARVPIVAMTAHAMAGDRERCMAAGMDDYITKPISLESLETIVEAQMNAPRGQTPPPPSSVEPSPADPSAKGKGAKEP